MSQLFAQIFSTNMSRTDLVTIHFYNLFVPAIELSIIVLTIYCFFVLLFSIHLNNFRVQKVIWGFVAKTKTYRN